MKRRSRVCSAEHPPLSSTDTVSTILTRQRELLNLHCRDHLGTFARDSVLRALSNEIECSTALPGKYAGGEARHTTKRRALPGTHPSIGVVERGRRDDARIRAKRRTFPQRRAFVSPRWRTHSLGSSSQCPGEFSLLQICVDEKERGLGPQAAGSGTSSGSAPRPTTGSQGTHCGTRLGPTRARKDDVACVRLFRNTDRSIVATSKTRGNRQTLWENIKF